MSCYWFGFSTLHIHHAASIPVLKSTTLTASYQLAPLWRPRVFIVRLEPAKVTLNCCAQTYTRTSTMCLSALFICFSLARSLRPPLPLSHLSLSHQAVERLIRSWFTVQLNVVIETLLQISLTFSRALIGLPLTCSRVGYVWASECCVCVWSFCVPRAVFRQGNSGCSCSSL